MSRTKPYLKVAAFVPAIVLVVPFVAYRAGAFERFTKPEAQPAAQQAPEGQPPQAFLYGSKSAPVFQPGEAPQQPAPDPTFMGESKYIVISGAPKGVVSLDPPKPAPNAAPDAPKP